MGYPELAAWLKADAQAPADATACAAYLNSTAHPVYTSDSIAVGTLGCACYHDDVTAARAPRTTTEIDVDGVVQFYTYGWA